MIFLEILIYTFIFPLKYQIIKLIVKDIKNKYNSILYMDTTLSLRSGDSIQSSKNVINSLIDDFKSHIKMGDQKIESDPESALINFMVGSNNLYTIFKIDNNLFNPSMYNGDLNINFQGQYYNLEEPVEVELLLKNIFSIIAHLQDVVKGLINTNKNNNENNENENIESLDKTCSESVKQVKYDPCKPNTVDYSSVIGLSKQKETIMNSFAYPLVYRNLYPKATKGMLFWGPPGSGKTYIMKATLNEIQRQDPNLGILYYAPTGANLKSKWVGGTEKNIAAYFDCASRDASWCEKKSNGKKFLSIIFIDEIEAVAKSRDKGGEQMTNSVNTLLQKMDGVESYDNVAVVAATNYPWALDSAILRRLPKRIYLPVPSKSESKQLLEMEIDRSFAKFKSYSDSLKVLEECIVKKELVPKRETSNKKNEEKDTCPKSDGKPPITNFDVTYKFRAKKELYFDMLNETVDGDLNNVLENAADICHGSGTKPDSKEEGMNAPYSNSDISAVSQATFSNAANRARLNNKYFLTRHKDEICYMSTLSKNKNKNKTQYQIIYNNPYFENDYLKFYKILDSDEKINSDINERDFWANLIKKRFDQELPIFFSILNNEEDNIKLNQELIYKKKSDFQSLSEIELLLNIINLYRITAKSREYRDLPNNSKLYMAVPIPKTLKQSDMILKGESNLPRKLGDSSLNYFFVRIEFSYNSKDVTDERLYSSISNLINIHFSEYRKSSSINSLEQLLENTSVEEDAIQEIFIKKISLDGKYLDLTIKTLIIIDQINQKLNDMFEGGDDVPIKKEKITTKQSGNLRVKKGEDDFVRNIEYYNDMCFTEYLFDQYGKYNTNSEYISNKDVNILFYDSQTKKVGYNIKFILENFEKLSQDVPNDSANTETQKGLFNTILEEFINRVNSNFSEFILMHQDKGMLSNEIEKKQKEIDAKKKTGSSTDELEQKLGLLLIYHDLVNKEDRHFFESNEKLLLELFNRALINMSDISGSNIFVTKDCSHIIYEFETNTQYEDNTEAPELSTNTYGYIQFEKFFAIMFKTYFEYTGWLEFMLKFSPISGITNYIGSAWNGISWLFSSLKGLVSIDPTTIKTSIVKYNFNIKYDSNKFDNSLIYLEDLIKNLIEFEKDGKKYLGYLDFNSYHIIYDIFTPIKYDTQSEYLVPRVQPDSTIKMSKLTFDLEMDPVGVQVPNKRYELTEENLIDCIKRHHAAGTLLLNNKYYDINQLKDSFKRKKFEYLLKERKRILYETYYEKDSDNKLNFISKCENFTNFINPKKQEVTYLFNQTDEESLVRYTQQFIDFTNPTFSNDSEMREGANSGGGTKEDIINRFTKLFTYILDNINIKNLLNNQDSNVVYIDNNIVVMITHLFNQISNKDYHKIKNQINDYSFYIIFDIINNVLNKSGNFYYKLPNISDEIRESVLSLCVKYEDYSKNKKQFEKIYKFIDTQESWDGDNLKDETELSKLKDYLTIFDKKKEILDKIISEISNNDKVSKIKLKKYIEKYDLPQRDDLFSFDNFYDNCNIGDEHTIKNPFMDACFIYQFLYKDNNKIFINGNIFENIYNNFTEQYSVTNVNKVQKIYQEMLSIVDEYRDKQISFILSGSFEYGDPNFSIYNNFIIAFQKIKHLFLILPQEEKKTYTYELKSNIFNNDIVNKQGGGFVDKVTDFLGFGNVPYAGVEGGTPEPGTRIELVSNIPIENLVVYKMSRSIIRNINGNFYITQEQKLNNKFLDYLKQQLLTYNESEITDFAGNVAYNIIKKNVIVEVTKFYKSRFIIYSWGIIHNINNYLKQKVFKDHSIQKVVNTSLGLLIYEKDTIKHISDLRQNFKKDLENASKNLNDYKRYLIELKTLLSKINDKQAPLKFDTIMKSEHFDFNTEEQKIVFKSDEIDKILNLANENFEIKYITPYFKKIDFNKILDGISYGEFLTKMYNEGDLNECNEYEKNLFNKNKSSGDKSFIAVREENIIYEIISNTIIDSSYDETGEISHVLLEKGIKVLNELESSEFINTVSKKICIKWINSLALEAYLSNTDLGIKLFKNISNLENSLYSPEGIRQGNITDLDIAHKQLVENSRVREFSDHANLKSINQTYKKYKTEFSSKKRNLNLFTKDLFENTEGFNSISKNINPELVEFELFNAGSSVGGGKKSIKKRKKNKKKLSKKKFVGGNKITIDCQGSSKEILDIFDKNLKIYDSKLFVSFLPEKNRSTYSLSLPCIQKTVGESEFAKGCLNSPSKFVWNNRSYDSRRDEYLIEENNYGLNLGSYVYNVLSKNNNKISYNQNQSGIRFDKILFGLIPGIKSVEEFISKLDTLPEDKLNTVYKKVFENIKSYYYNTIEYCISADVNTAFISTYDKQISKEDKISHLTTFLENIYGYKEKYNNLCEFSFNNIFKRMIFETTTSHKSFIPNPDYSDKSKSESNDLSNIRGKNLHYSRFSPSCAFGTGSFLKRDASIVLTNTKNINEMKTKLYPYAETIDNQIYLINLNNLKYLFRKKVCYNEADNDIDFTNINELIQYESINISNKDAKENLFGVGGFDNMIKSICNVIDVDEKPILNSTVLPNEINEMEANKKLMMRTLSIRFEDYVDASKEVKSSIDLYEIERFEHYKTYNKDPDSDPNFKPKHGSSRKKE